ncbi:DUF637 domain-containing protein [Erwinia sp. AnSW2-5]|uniref:endonuclease toxin domain-containing protein n=1 Tax=Erwinia sp. AnSW2-5 TaxID=3367692 RepID=UPI00385B85BD
MRFESVTTHLYREESKAWSESLTQNGSQLTSGGLLTLMANGSILFQATKLLAKGALEVAAQGGYLYAQAMEESSSYERTTHKRKWWGKKTTVRQTGHSQSNKVTEFSAAGDLTLLSRDDATFEASKISAGKNARLVSTGGKVNFLAVKNSAFAQTLTLSKGFFIKQSQRGYQADTWVLPSVYTGGTLTVEASSGISAEVKAASARQLQATLAVLGNAPGTEWLKGLSTRNDVQWQQVQDAYQQWSWSHRSLNPVVGAVIAIAAAAVTAGSGLAASVGALASSGSGGLASSGSGGLAATAAYGAGYSGMMALSSQTAVALVENRGNLSKTFDTLSSSDSVKALATSMAIGGALAGFDQISDLQAANPGNARLPVLSNGDWINTAQRVAGQSVIRSVLNSTINGGSFGHNLSDALLATVGDQLNAEGAKLVGDNGELLGVAGKSLSHAVVAGIAAEISGGNATGAAAGAIGAELAGVMLGDSLIKPSEWQRQSEQQAQVARVLGATLGALVTGKASGAESGATGAEYAFRYNYLTHQQQQQMDEELAEAKTPYDKMAVTVNWGVVSDNQDDIFNAGVISGVSMDLWESAKGLAELASNPRELWVAFRNVINEDDGWARVGNNVKQGFLNRIDAGLTYFDQAGTDSAFSSGLEFGHLTSDVATAFLGAAGVAKGALKLGEVTAGAVLEDSATLRAPVVRQIDTGIEWEGGIQGQGMPWEDYVGKDLPAEARLPKLFMTFDYFDQETGHAVSVKTLNTNTAARIKDPKQIYYSLKGNIDDAINFKEYGLSGKIVKEEIIKSREVNIAIPKAITDAQWAEINRAVQYGKANNVNVKITVVK